MSGCVGEGWVNVLVLPDLAALAHPTPVPHMCAVGHHSCPAVCQETDPNPGSAPQLKELAQEDACPGSGRGLALLLFHTVCLGP